MSGSGDDGSNAGDKASAGEYLMRDHSCVRVKPIGSAYVECNTSHLSSPAGHWLSRTVDRSMLRMVHISFPSLVTDLSMSSRIP